MRIVYGIWGRWVRLFGGIRELFLFFFFLRGGVLLTVLDRFLIKDAQDDLQGMRLKV
jgi:hypothetical protein